RATYEIQGKGIQGLHASDNKVCVALEYDGLQVINPAAPSPSVDGVFHTYQDVSAVAVSGNHAYALNFPIGVQRFDITAPESPRLVGTYAYGFDRRTRTSLEALGDAAYVFDAEQGLSVIDFTVPSQPRVSARLEAQTGLSALTVSLFKNQAF